MDEEAEVNYQSCHCGAVLLFKIPDVDVRKSGGISAWHEEVSKWRRSGRFS
jgi:hypothetical protein